MPANGSRLPKSEATRLKLLDCAVHEIVESGPDRLGFTAIARRAGMSTGALYARYENADELLVDVWLHKCLPELRAVVSQIESAAADDGGPALLQLAEAVNSLDPVLLATARILVCARRNDTLFEVVNPSFHAVVDAAANSVPGIPYALSHVFGYILGASGTGLTHVDWVGPLTLAISSVAAASQGSVETKGVENHSETPFQPMGDEVDNKLFEAMADVIGKVGVERATVSRIARMAAVNPATIYMRYEDKDALLERVVTIIAEMGVSRNSALVRDFGERGIIDGGVAMFRGNATDEYSGVRRLRLETVMASAIHPRLRDVQRRVYVEAVERDAATLGASGITSDPVLMAFAVHMRFAFYGHALVREYGYLAPSDPWVESMLRNMFDRFAEMMSRFLSGTRASTKKK